MFIISVLEFFMPWLSKYLMSLNRKLGTDVQYLLLGANANGAQDTSGIASLSSIFISHVHSITKFQKFSLCMVSKTTLHFSHHGSHLNLRCVYQITWYCFKLSTHSCLTLLLSALLRAWCLCSPRKMWSHHSMFQNV